METLGFDSNIRDNKTTLKITGSERGGSIV